MHAGYAAAHQEGDAGGDDPAERGGESEGAAAALGAILFRQPERVDGEVGAADAQEEEADQEPEQRVFAKIEHVPQAERDEQKHQEEIEAQRSAAPEAVGGERQYEAAEN